MIHKNVGEYQNSPDAATKNSAMPHVKDKSRYLITYFKIISLFKM
jgi:hypothetical protein